MPDVDSFFYNLGEAHARQEQYLRLMMGPPVRDRDRGNALHDFNVPEREKQEVLAAFNGEKGEVSAASQPGEVNWRRWR